jgi:hypothetical protein
MTNDFILGVLPLVLPSSSGKLTSIELLPLMLNVNRLELRMLLHVFCWSFC